MEQIRMADIIPLIGLPEPNDGQSAYNVPCPCCDENSKKKHLNINFEKNVFRCPRCGFSGGIFDLYAFYAGIDRRKARETLLARLNITDVMVMVTDRERRRKVEKKSIECPLTDIDARHETYCALLNKLKLASDHHQNLRNRGFSDDSIQDLGYRTMPAMGFTAIAKQLHRDGYYLAGVPGFFHNEKGEWTLIREKRGILIPARTPDGKIQGLQLRIDDFQKGKFRWISSVGKQDGCKAESWTHISGKPSETVILTEGPMKADAIHFLTGQTVVAVPGVNSLNHLPEMLQFVKENGTKRIMTAFDMDYLKNPFVRDAYHNLAATISSADLEYGTYLWDPEYKGLDDYVWHCRQAGTL